MDALAHAETSRPSGRSVTHWLWAGLACLIALAFLRVVIGFVSLPISLLGPANFMIGALFLGTPLIAIVIASRFSWRPGHALVAVLIGFALQFGCFAVNSQVFRFHGPVAPWLVAFGQVGLPIWCAGLGALIATLIKERNLLVPIAVFLILYDAFLVLSPQGITGKVVREAPQMLSNFAVQIPQVKAGPAKGSVDPGTLAGPADFVFLAMFMIAIYRFGMRGKQTAQLVIPVLLAYMFIVQTLSIPLPALVPIGACVMIANWGELKLTRDEKLSTVFIALIGLALLTWSFMKSKRGTTAPPAPSKSIVGQS